MTERRLAALVAVLLAASGACGGKSRESALPTGVSDFGVGAPGARPALPTKIVEGHVVTLLGPGAIGPFLARRGEGTAAAGLVGWITGAEGSGRRLLVVPVSADGRPKDREKTVALVGNDTTTLVVGTMRGAMPGFVLAWTSLTDRGESLWAAVVGDDGAVRGKAIELTRTTDDIVWMDVVPTEKGAVCVWAEETRDGHVDMTAAALDGPGTVRGAPTRVARDVDGWHVLEVAGGIGLSTVSKPDAGSAKDKDKARDKESKAAGAGVLSFQKLDADARLVGPPIAITPSPSVSGDVEVARAQGGLVFAWTDRTGGEPAVAATMLPDGGSPEPPRSIVSGRGGAALLHLKQGRTGPVILFEAPVRKKTDRRRLHVATLLPNLALGGKPASFEVEARTTPELAATASGFAALAAIRPCEPGSSSCEDVAPVATMLRFDEKARLVQSEALAFGTEASPLGWGLACEGEACVALAASSGTPARIRSAHVRPRGNIATAAAVPPPPKDAPRAMDVASVAAGESVLDVSTAEIGDTTLVATLSGTESKTQSLTVSTRIVDADGSASAPVVVATRALSTGGVAVAAAAKPEDGALVAWVARDGGDPEVHLARLDARGKKTGEIRLTDAKGDASDVTLTAVEHGFLVAWVDGRHGNGEVYAARVGLALNRIGREERITNALGDASDLVARGNGGLVWLAWADPRESPRDGAADVYVAAVSARDAKRSGDEIRIVASAAHSRTPSLVLADERLHVAWIEDAPHGIEAPSSSGYGAMWCTIEPNDRTASEPRRVPVAGEGAATSVALAVVAGRVRSVVARTTGEAIALDAVDLSVSSPRAYPLLTLDGPPSMDVALSMPAKALYFNDDGPAPRDRRLRRARIEWSP